MPDFVILANARWNTEGRGGNSSQQYAAAVGRRGWRVSYVQKDRANRLTPLEELDLGPGTVAMCDMPWVDFYFDLFVALKARGCRTAYRVVDNWHMTRRRAEYDEEREIAFITQADAAFASSPLNVERFKSIRPDISLLRNGVDLEMFWNWQGDAPPDLKRGEPTVVFVASFWDPDWTDWEALFCGAESRPEMSLNVLGQASVPGGRALPENLHLLGSRKWTDLPAYLHHCDVGAVAYHAQRTRYNNPLKVLEYLACGLPVVCCPNASITDYPHIYTYASPEEFGAKIAEAAGAAIDRERLYRALEQHTWEVRLDGLLAKLDAVSGVTRDEAGSGGRCSLADLLAGGGCPPSDTPNTGPAGKAPRTAA